ncbi:MAG TPA: putative Ig domain-containing protein, partial [Streptosporangiaceae bacterium]|nr:putative Ig domain-containing protein [Streptosporangiaceae bacterium]
VATAAPAVANAKPSPSPSPTPSSSPSTAAAPTLDTSHFACSNGVCEIGPGNVGTSFAAGLYATAPNSPTFLITVVSGSLPPGLQLASQNGDPWTITGTPTTAGTYAFTVQITASNTNGPYGPSATQQLTITIGTGSSDRRGYTFTRL